MSEIIGLVTYCSGEQQAFTDSSKFIKAVQHELDCCGISGFTFKVLTEDAATRKAMDDLIYNEFGEENPHDLAYYQNTKRIPRFMTGVKE